MMQEERQLLLTDLCARLPYGVICKSNSYNNILFNSSHISLIESEEIKPYLRSIDSMTEEEKKEFGIIACEGNIDYPYGIFFRCQDWLNKNMFDYRDLIDKGLAIEVTEEKNPYEIRG